jgi:hypothetical protein
MGKRNKAKMWSADFTFIQVVCKPLELPQTKVFAGLLLNPVPPDVWEESFGFPAGFLVKVLRLRLNPLQTTIKTHFILYGIFFSYHERSLHFVRNFSPLAQVS